MKVRESDTNTGETVDFTLDDYAQYTRYLDTLLAERGVSNVAAVKDIDPESGNIWHGVSYHSPTRGTVWVRAWSS